MLNIVIPMAGRGSRFAVAGYGEPKPLIPIRGVPMIRLVIDNLRPRGDARFIFVCQRAHIEAYDLRARLGEWCGVATIVALDGITEGAACTVVEAAHLIDTDAPLMIANSDQYIDASIDDYLDHMREARLDGLIMTMTARDPKWSFVALDEHRLVRRVVEKVAISDEATVGIYNFARGRDFVGAARAMIARDERVNGEFYVAPVYNELIAQGAAIGIRNIGADRDGMYGLGTPADLDYFLAAPVAAKAVRLPA